MSVGHCNNSSKQMLRGLWPGALPSPRQGQQLGGVAQRLEQRLHKPRVAGSIPAAAITKAPVNPGLRTTGAYSSINIHLFDCELDCKLTACCPKAVPGKEIAM